MTRLTRTPVSTAKRMRRTALALFLAAVTQQACATDFTVTNTSDTGAGSLRQAITDLNLAGAGTHQIILDAGLAAAIVPASDLPSIVGTGQVITLVGNGKTIDGNNVAKTFSLDAGSLTFNNVALLNGTPNVNAGAVVFVQTADGTYSSDVSGTGSLTKQGTAKLTLSGANTYSGGTTVTGGTLEGTTTSLQGAITNNAAVIVNQNTDGAYAGVMSGTGTLAKEGTGKVTLSGANTYSGGTTVTGGTLEGTTTSLQGAITNNAAVIINQNTDGAYAGVMSGTGTLTKEGTGQLTLGGTSTYTGATTVNGGSLIVNGQIASAATVAVGGTLGGTGTLGNTTVSGTIAAGNSIGELNVNGTYVQNAGSTIEVEVNDAGTIAGVNVDHINATGPVSINGGAVDVQAATGTYTEGTQYTFLTGSSLTGTFDSINDDLDFFDAALGYTGTTAFFTLNASSKHFRNIANTTNQRAIGQYLIDNRVSANADFNNYVANLSTLTDVEIREALTTLNTEMTSSVSQIGILNTSIVLRSITQQLMSTMPEGGGVRTYQAAAEQSNADIQLVSYTPATPASHRQTCRSIGHRMWALGYGLGGSADSDGNAAGIEYGLGGVTVGLDHFLNQCTRVGVFGGYVGANYDSVGLAQSTSVNGGQFGAHFTRQLESFYQVGIVGFQFDGYESERNLGGGVRATGNYDGWQNYNYFETGMRLGAKSAKITLKPFVGLQYAYIGQDSYSETGAGALNLAVSDLDTNSLRGSLGARTQFSVGRLQQEVRAIWVHEYLDTSTLVDAQFAAVGGPGFQAAGLGVGRDWAVLGTGLTAMLGNWQISGDFDIQTNDRQTAYVGSGSLNYSW